MTAMSSGLRKFTLTAHTTSSVGFLGAVGAFIAIACAGLASQHMPLVRAAYLAMELIAWSVIVPLAVLLITGVMTGHGPGQHFAR